MRPTDQQVAAHLHKVFAEAIRTNADTVVFRVDSPPLADGFQPIGQTDVDEPAIAIIGEYFHRQSQGLSAHGKNWRLQSYSSDRIEVRRVGTDESGASVARNNPLEEATTVSGSKEDLEGGEVMGKLLNCIIRHAISSNATAICIEPSGERTRISFKVDEKWAVIDRSNHKRFVNSIVGYIIALSGLTPEMGQEGSVDINVGGKMQSFPFLLSFANNAISVTLHVVGPATPIANEIMPSSENRDSNQVLSNTQEQPLPTPRRWNSEDDKALPESASGQKSEKSKGSKAQMIAIIIVATSSLFQLLGMIPRNRENFEQAWNEQILEPIRESAESADPEPAKPASFRPSAIAAKYDDPSDGTWAGMFGLHVDPTPETFRIFAEHEMQRAQHLVAGLEPVEQYRFDLQKAESLIAPFLGVWSRDFFFDYLHTKETKQLVEINFRINIAAEYGLVDGKWSCQKITAVRTNAYATAVASGSDNVAKHRAQILAEKINEIRKSNIYYNYENIQQLSELGRSLGVAGEDLVQAAFFRALRQSAVGN